MISSREQNSRPRVAVIGGRGFIGNRVAALLAPMYELDIWDLPEGDIRRPEIIGEKVSSFRPEAVVNFAGILGGVGSENVRDLFETNFVGTLNLLEACRIAGVPAFVFASSLTVHGMNAPDQPRTLASPFNPIHAYGASKAASEYAMQEYARRFGMTAIALRPTMVLGDTATPHAPIEFIKGLLRGEEPVIFGTGEHEREWVWIDDVASGFVRALEFSRTAQGFHPFFLSGNRVRMRDLAQRCADRLGGRIRFEPSGAKAFTLTADTAESDAALGWRATTDIPTMVERLIDIQRAKIGK